jgi:hypothetical protein
MNIDRLRPQKAETNGDFRERYTIRAGGEGTNSELKRAYGLGRLRLRGGQRVRLLVYLKALACNFKRVVGALLEKQIAETGIAEVEIPVPATG